MILKMTTYNDRDHGDDDDDDVDDVDFGDDDNYKSRSR